jgi:hypothetical protein
MATRLTSEPHVHVLNDIVLDQVLVRSDGGSLRTTDEATVDVTAACWPTAPAGSAAPAGT